MEHTGSTSSTFRSAFEPEDMSAQDAAPTSAPVTAPPPEAEEQPDGSWMEGDPMYENYQ